MINRRALLGLMAVAMVALVIVLAVYSAAPALKWSVIGSGGGPALGTQNGLVAALGQPVSGRVSNGYTIYSGLYFDSPAPAPAGYRINLPAIMVKSCVGMASSTEIEPNDSATQANGPLCPNRIYTGSPDSHGSSRDYDWFTFNWSGNGTITIDLDNFPTVGQLLLYFDPKAPYLDRDYDQLDGHYTVSYTGTGQSGTYYILVFVPDGHQTGNGDYTLAYK